MKITKSQLKEIIKEEITKVFYESNGYHAYLSGYDSEEQMSTSQSREEYPIYSAVVEKALTDPDASAEEVVNMLMTGLKYSEGVKDKKGKTVKDEFMKIVNADLMSIEDIQEELLAYINRDIYGATAFRR